MIEIDGSSGEGGGQILRTSLALSMCTGQPFALTRIRAGRAKPGLMRQHLTCVNAAAAVCGAQVLGAELSSQTLHFTPGPVRAGDYAFNVGTAGSCTLVLQTVWPALWMKASPSEITLVGGTHNPMAPSFHFLQRAYLPLGSLRRALSYPSAANTFDDKAIADAIAKVPREAEYGEVCFHEGADELLANDQGTNRLRPSMSGPYPQ